MTSTKDPKQSFRLQNKAAARISQQFRLYYVRQLKRLAQSAPIVPILVNGRVEDKSARLCFQVFWVVWNSLGGFSL
jgi:hypothetical protein